VLEPLYFYLPGFRALAEGINIFMLYDDIKVKADNRLCVSIHGEPSHNAIGSVNFFQHI
jgi:hypothetical protein